RGSLLIIALGGLALPGCSTVLTGRNPPLPSPPGTVVAPPPPGQERQLMTGLCPTQTPDTTVTAMDLGNAVALDFRTTGNLAQLRSDIAGFAERHNKRREMLMGNGLGGSGLMGDDALMPESTATAVDIPGGARMVLVPDDPTRIEALRAHAWTEANAMNRG